MTIWPSEGSQVLVAAQPSVVTQQFGVPATVPMVPWPRHGAAAKATVAINSMNRILMVPPKD
jgi:hypothetical protein